MENIRREVAKELFDALQPFANSACKSQHKFCQKCEASEICLLAEDVRYAAAKILSEFECEKNPEDSTTDKPEPDQRKALCEALTGTVNKLHSMMEAAMGEADVETVLDISGQIIDCAECIVKLQSGVVSDKLLAELVKCQAETEGKEA